MPLFPDAPTAIHPYFGYRSEAGLYVKARALRQREPGFEREGSLRAFATLLSQYASHEVRDLPVTLEARAGDGSVHRFDSVTDAEGFVTFDLTLPDAWDRPVKPAWESVLFHYENADGPQCTDGHVLVPGSESAIAIISDIDDTIIETGVTGGIGSVLKNWRRLLATMPGSRDAVTGADRLYGTLGGEPQDTGAAGERMRASRRSFFYVSSSPWNLYAYLVAFKRAKGLPLGPMALRDWGLNRETFGSGSHGGHKVQAIRRIVAAFPELRFALVGDDTQGDLPAYAEVAAADPGRIAAIFIRRASPEAFTAEERQAQDTIRAAGIPLWVGPSYEEGEAFLRDTGLAGETEAAQLVAAVEDEATKGGK